MLEVGIQQLSLAVSRVFWREFIVHIMWIIVSYMGLKILGPA